MGRKHRADDGNGASRGHDTTHDGTQGGHTLGRCARERGVGGGHGRWDAPPPHKKLFVVKNFCIDYLNILERDNRKFGQRDGWHEYGL
jgi:hypothetical protein